MMYKKMKFIFLIILFSCNTVSKYQVTGIAMDARAGAIVYISNDSIYYVGDLERWPCDYREKEVTVKGKLRKENSNLGIQGILEKTTILNPKIKNEIDDTWFKLKRIKDTTRYIPRISQ